MLVGGLAIAVDAASIGAYYSGSAGMAGPLLTLDASQEAAKNGCGAYCTTTVSSSGSGASQAYSVTVTDTRPKQSFSAMSATP